MKKSGNLFELLEQFDPCTFRLLSTHGVIVSFFMRDVGANHNLLDIATAVGESARNVERALDDLVADELVRVDVVGGERRFELNNVAVALESLPGVSVRQLFAD